MGQAGVNFDFSRKWLEMKPCQEIEPAFNEACGSSAQSTAGRPRIHGHTPRQSTHSGNFSNEVKRC